MTVIINNVEYSYQRADINYQVESDMVINIILSNNYTATEIAQTMKNYKDISITFNKDTYEHLTFMSVTKTYPDGDLSKGLQVIFVNADNALLDK